MKTQGIKYTGSKLKLIPNILALIPSDVKTILDGFSGSTRVSQAFAMAGYQVTSNDISEYSKVFATCYLNNHKSTDIIEHLNGLKGVSGWFTEHYGGLDNNGCSIQTDGLKKPFQIHNTMKLDAIRDEIDLLDLSLTEKSLALTGLILAMDEVDSTLGHFSSYLRNWSDRSYKQMTLKVPNLFENLHQNTILKEDVFNIQNEFDLVYYDVPYGSNNDKMPSSRVRYSSYYHFWETVCLNDKPALFGAANRRVDSRDGYNSNVFEEFRKIDDRYIASIAIEKLIKQANSKYVMFSYSSGGRVSLEELVSIFSSYGSLQIHQIDYKQNVMAAMKYTNEWLREDTRTHKEYLFLLDKSKKVNI